MDFPTSHTGPWRRLICAREGAFDYEPTSISGLLLQPCSEIPSQSLTSEAVLTQPLRQVAMTPSSQLQNKLQDLARDGSSNLKCTNLKLEGDASW